MAFKFYKLTAQIIKNKQDGCDADPLLKDQLVAAHKEYRIFVRREEEHKLKLSRTIFFKTDSAANALSGKLKVMLYSVKSSHYS